MWDLDFPYFVYKPSCAAQQKGISSTFCRILRNKSLHQTAKERELQTKEIEIKFFSLACFAQFSFFFS